MASLASAPDAEGAAGPGTESQKSGGAAANEKNIALGGGAGPTSTAKRERANLVNLAVLLIGFILTVIMIWRSFQRMLDQSNSRRQRKEWQDSKSKRQNIGHLEVFGGGGRRAA